MALVVKDRVKETTTTTGTGTITLGGAAAGFQSFTAIGDGNTTYYTIYDQPAGEWEVGIGTYTASGTTLSRDTVLSSSNAGSLVNFGAGSKSVFCTNPAERAVYQDVAGSYPVQNTFGTLNATTLVATTATLTNGTVSSTPASGNDITNKTYVDALAASGVHYHTPVYVEVPSTTGNLNATYNNGSSGVGATLTNAGTQAAFTADGVAVPINSRVLIYNQTNAYENGVYTLTTVGSGSTNWVLTRATDADTYDPFSPNSLGQGDAFFVTNGNTGAGETYICNTVGTITFGTTAITFAQISSAQIYSAGTGLTLSGTQFSITNTGTAGTYGSASSVPVLTTNAQGQVTSVTNTAIAIASGAVSGLAASATTDTTNASNISSGTLPAGRLSGSYTGVSGVGTLTAGTWNASTIGAAYGGTGLTSYTIGDIVYASDSTTLSKLADVATGNALISGGVGSAPSWGKVGLATHVSGTLPVANGGTGVTSSTGTGSVVLNTLPTFGSTGVKFSGSTSGEATVVASATAGTPTLTLPTSTGTFALTSELPTVNNATLTMNVSGTGLSGSQTFTANQGTNATFTVTSNATSANTASTIVARDASGNFSAGTITASLSGNATSATTATNATNTTTTDDTTTATTVYPNWVAATTGNNPNKVSSTKLTFVPSTGTLSATAFSGSGASLSSLNASNLTSGTVPDARISGSYTGMTNLTGTGTVDFSKFYGNAADTVTAPSFSWTTDTNTGLWQPAADQIGFTAGGVNRLTVSTTAITSTVPFSGSGASLTSLTAANISSGNLGSGVLPYSTVSATASAFKIPFLNTTGVASGNYALLHDSAATFTYNPSTDTIVAGTFSGAHSGSGASLTSLNASNLASGTVPDARISGSYTGMTNLTGSGTVDFSQFLGNAADSVTTPSFSFTGDTNTGMYQPAADQVGFTAGGVNRLTVSTTAITSTVPFSGSGASLTSLNASNLASGTVPDARISGSYTGMVNLTGSGTVDFSKFYGSTADTAAAPSFSWTTDTNTGVWSPAADQLGFSTGGTNRLTITTTLVNSALPVSAFMYENPTTIASNYTVSTNSNAMSAGPITINTGITVTIPTGSSWSIV